MKRYICELEVLTAVHIGTGEELSPLEYYIVHDASDKGNGKFVRFSMDKIIGSLKKEERDHLLEIIDKDDYLKLHYFFKDGGKAAKYNAIEYEAEISSELEREYSKYVQQGRNSNSFLNNQMFISETKHVPGTMLPYIPGSSIKGAIRTSVLDYLLTEGGGGNNIDRFRSRRSSDLEANILKAENRRGGLDIDKDPFRALQVSDCIMPDSSSMYVGKMNTEMSIRTEVVAGRFMGKTSKSTFDVNINDKIFKYLSKEAGEFREITNITGDIHDFSMEILRYEKDKFYNSRANKWFVKLIEEYGKIDPNDNECLIRIGRYSQQQGVTLSAFHDSQTGRTRTLLNTDSGSIPMGWCRLKFREI